MTATKPQTITVDHVRKGIASGIVILPTRGHALRNIADMRPGQLQEAADLAAEVYKRLVIASLEMDYPNNRPLQTRGWWVSVHIGGKALAYEVYTFAAWLLTQETSPDYPYPLRIYVLGSNLWEIHSPPECTEDHLHSKYPLKNGRIVCVPVHYTINKVRKMEREGAFP